MEEKWEAKGGVVEFGRWKIRPAESGVPRRGLQGALKVEEHLHSPFRRVNTVTPREYRIAQSPIASCAWHIPSLSSPALLAVFRPWHFLDRQFDKSMLVTPLDE